MTFGPYRQSVPNLKNCPFCGRNDEIAIICSTQPWLKTIGCMRCGATVGCTNYHNDGWADKLIETWEYRVRKEQDD